MCYMKWRIHWARLERNKVNLYHCRPNFYDTLWIIKYWVLFVRAFCLDNLILIHTRNLWMICKSRFDCISLISVTIIWEEFNHETFQNKTNQYDGVWSGVMNDLSVFVIEIESAEWHKLVLLHSTRTIIPSKELIPYRTIIRYLKVKIFVATLAFKIALIMHKKELLGT